MKNRTNASTKSKAVQPTAQSQGFAAHLILLKTHDITI